MITTRDYQKVFPIVSDADATNSFCDVMAVSEDGKHLAVGSKEREAVYTYTTDTPGGGHWIFLNKITGPSGSKFGASVAFLTTKSDETLLFVGAPEDDTGNAGKVYIYIQDTTNEDIWVSYSTPSLKPEAVLSTGSFISKKNFGTSIVIADETSYGSQDEYGVYICAKDTEYTDGVNTYKGVIFKFRVTSTLNTVTIPIVAERIYHASDNDAVVDYLGPETVGTAMEYCDGLLFVKAGLSSGPPSSAVLVFFVNRSTPLTQTIENELIKIPASSTSLTSPGTSFGNRIKCFKVNLFNYFIAISAETAEITGHTGAGAVAIYRSGSVIPIVFKSSNQSTTSSALVSTPQDLTLTSSTPASNDNFGAALELVSFGASNPVSLIVGEPGEDPGRISIFNLSKNQNMTFARYDIPTTPTNTFNEIISSVTFSGSYRFGSNIVFTYFSSSSCLLISSPNLDGPPSPSGTANKGLIFSITFNGANYESFASPGGTLDQGENVEELFAVTHDFANVSRQFGTSIALDTDTSLTMVVGASNTSTTDRTGVYTFIRPSPVYRWKFAQLITNSPTSEEYGESVAIDKNVSFLVVGRPGVAPHGELVVYPKLVAPTYANFFDRWNTTGTPVSPSENTRFGEVLCVSPSSPSKNYIVTSSFDATTNKIYVYTYDETGATLALVGGSSITVTGGSPSSSGVGCSLAIPSFASTENPYVFVGDSDSDKVFIISFDGTNWTSPSVTLVPPISAPGFGKRIAVSDDGTTLGVCANDGKVFIFRRPSTASLSATNWKVSSVIETPLVTSIDSISLKTVSNFLRVLVGGTSSTSPPTTRKVFLYESSSYTSTGAWSNIEVYASPSNDVSTTTGYTGTDFGESSSINIINTNKAIVVGAPLARSGIESSNVPEAEINNGVVISYAFDFIPNLETPPSPSPTPTPTPSPSPTPPPTPLPEGSDTTFLVVSLIVGIVIVLIVIGIIVGGVYWFAGKQIRRS